VYKIISQKIPKSIELFPQIYKAVETFYLKKKLNFYDIYLQKEKLKEFIINSCASEEEKEIFFISELFSVLKRIYSLDVSRKEFDGFIKRRDKLKNAALKYLNVAEYNVLSALAQNAVTDLIYENNIKRDSVFFKSVKKIINPKRSVSVSKVQEVSEISSNEISKIKDFESVYVVVAGGFHKDFCGFLKDGRISHIKLMPDIKDSNLQKEKYFDALRVPGKLKSRNPHYEVSAFAPPLLNILNSKADEDMKDVMLKNIISAWVESAKEYSISESEIFKDILVWLEDNGIGEETIEKYPSLKRVMAGGKNVSAHEQEADFSSENKGGNKKESLLSKIKGFFKFKGSWTFANIAVSSSKMSKARSHAEVIEAVKEVKKLGADSFEFVLKKSAAGHFYFELTGGVEIPFREALSVIDGASKEKSKNSIIIKFDDSVGESAYEILSVIGENKNYFSIITSNREFIRVCRGLYKNVKFIYEFYADSPDEILSLEDVAADGVYTDAQTFKKNGDYLIAGADKKSVIFIKTDKDDAYPDFIFKGGAAITLICDDFQKYSKQKKESKAAYRNSFITPCIQLVLGFEFFASFSTIYLQQAGYSLSSLGLFFALCSPLSVAGSIISAVLSKRFGERNVLMANLLLHCAGDSLLLLAAVSPVFLALGVGVPAMAAAGISSLLIPFIHSSLSKSGRAEKFESFYGKTRSVFWIGLAISSVAGSWLAQFIGFSGVIAMSCITITGLSIFSLIFSSSFEKSADDKEFSPIEPSVGKKKEFFDAVKAVFKIKDLRSVVILNFIVDTGLFVFLALAVQTMLTGAGLGIGWLGIIMFAANLVQSLASKIVEKVSSLVNNAFHRSVYFMSLAASAGGFMVFGSPVFLILFYIFANFWQGAASVIEPSKIEKNVAQDKLPFWFSAKTAMTSLLAAGMQVLIAVSIENFALKSVLAAIAVIITAVSVLFGFALKDTKQKASPSLEIYKIDENNDIRNMLSAA
ncbi:MAG: MFS transporter, partial [Endomicrobium sp.]|nr:MFS transporter [Endomicrobium sp.]